MNGNNPPGLFVKLIDLDLQGFRSFRKKESLRFNPGLNILIGPNNAGKSNIIRAILAIKNKFDITYEGGGRVFSTKQPGFSEEDHHLIDGKPMDIELKYNILFNYFWTEIIEDLAKTGKRQIQDSINKILTPNNKEEKRAALYITFKSLGNLGETRSDLVSQLSSPLKESPGYKLDTPTVDSLMAYIAENRLKKIPAQIVYVPDMRKITLAENPSIGGEGAITKIKNLLNPVSKDQKEAELKKRVLKDIKSYIGRLFGVGDYRAIDFDIIGEPPRLILITPQFKGNIEDLGSGIREIVILALDTAGLCNAIMLVEEPENHLHPTLIRTWLSAVSEDIEKNNNQYIITTHSPVLLDQSIKKTVYKIKNNKEGFSEVELADHSNKLYDAIIEIGARPSDILLPNCVIWVEGITDIYFLRMWLGFLSPELIEGRHFAFITYGGACIAVVQVGEATGEETDEEKEYFSDLYDILNISRNCIVVMDSDLTEEENKAGEKFGSRLRASKTRVYEACKATGGKRQVLCWVTSGREIENYISDTTIKKIFGIGHLGPFEKLGVVAGTEGKYKSKKPKAKIICNTMTKVSEFESPKLDIQERIGELITKIKDFNAV